jgi:dsRNA-specific ribonuclease
MEALTASFFLGGGFPAVEGLLRVLGMWPRLEENNPTATSDGGSDGGPSKEDPSKPNSTTNKPSQRLVSDLPDFSLPYFSLTTRHSVEVRKLSPPSPSSTAVAQAIHGSTGYSFSDKTVLQHCLLLEPAERDLTVLTNEAMEYLGDAVLDFAVTWRLFTRQQWAAQGELSMKRASCVANRRLAAIAFRVGLHRLVIVPPCLSELQADLAELDSISTGLKSVCERASSDPIAASAAEASVAIVAAAIASAAGEGTPGGNSRRYGKLNAQAVARIKRMERQNMEDVSSELAVILQSSQAAQKCLADSLEALIGAVFVDCGKSMEVTVQFLEHIGALPEVGFE